MLKYRFKGSGKEIEAVQWDGSIPHLKGINFHLAKHGLGTVASTASGEAIMYPVQYAAGKVGMPLRESDYVVIVNNRTRATIVRERTFNNNFEGPIRGEEN